MYKRVIFASLAIFFLLSAASAQNPQNAAVTVSLNEAFFDALLDAVFTNFSPPEFSIAQGDGNHRGTGTRSENNSASNAPVFSFANYPAPRRPSDQTSPCAESIKILREMNGVRTVVRFREGKIYVPLAFSGSYEPPFIGCVDFAGWAETNIDLEFDRTGRRLIGRARVLNVNLNGTGGVGGTVVAKLVQGAIDKKLNPIEIMSLDKLTFGVPIPNSGNLQMKATDIRPAMANGVLNVVITYQFVKT